MGILLFETFQNTRSPKNLTKIKSFTAVPCLEPTALPATKFLLLVTTMLSKPEKKHCFYLLNTTMHVLSCNPSFLTQQKKCFNRISLSKSLLGREHMKNNVAYMVSAIPLLATINCSASQNMKFESTTERTRVENNHYLKTTFSTHMGHCVLIR